MASVMHGLNVVPVRIECVGSVIVGVVLRPEAWRSVIASASSEGGGVKGIDDGAAWGSEGDV
jgi:hypothetical protein